jgi:hypothetical protein
MTEHPFEQLLEHFNISRTPELLENIRTTYKDTILPDNLIERIEWAIIKPPEFVARSGEPIGSQRKIAAIKEKSWGNIMINKTDCKQWTTSLGENLVKDILKIKGENPRKPLTKNHLKPDWETDDYIYEVKTRSWNVGGTAGEKVLGTFIKYQDVPELYGKSLKIVCVAYQEEELTNGKTAYYGEKRTKKTQEILNLAKEWNIEYITFSDLVKSLLTSS